MIRSRRWGGLLGCVADVAAHVVRQFRDESVDFFPPPFNQTFDAAVGEVANVSGNVESTGDAAGGVAKTNALNAAGKVDNSLLNVHDVYNSCIGRAVAYIIR